MNSISYRSYLLVSFLWAIFHFLSQRWNFSPNFLVMITGYLNNLRSDFSNYEKVETPSYLNTKYHNVTLIYELLHWEFVFVTSKSKYIYREKTYDYEITFVVLLRGFEFSVFVLKIRFENFVRFNVEMMEYVSKFWWQILFFAREAFRNEGKVIYNYFLTSVYTVHIKHLNQNRRESYSKFIFRWIVILQQNK